MSRPYDNGGVGMSGGPNSIVVDPNLWNLRAAPAVLEEDARLWRSLQKATTSADGLVSGAAKRIIGTGWSGMTAEAYDTHRRKVTGDLDQLAETVGRIADQLEEMAAMLRTNQDLLTREAEKLSGVPAKQGAQLTFHPADAAQSQLVHEAVGVAKQIRSRVDAQLASRKSALEAAQDEFVRIADKWKPRTFGMMNLNIGMGHENFLWNSGGTDHGDIPALAQSIADQKVDLVTMQEVAKVEAENLERELEARTGDKWTVHFGETKSAPYWSDGLLPRSVYEPFGNAVAVREGTAIESSQYVDTHGLNAQDGKLETPEGKVGDTQPRGALEVKIRLGGS